VVQINVCEDLKYLEVQKKSQNKSSLGETNIKHYKIMCRYELDIEPGTAESVVEFNSTLDLVKQKVLSNLTQHWTWYSRKCCRI